MTNEELLKVASDMKSNLPPKDRLREIGEAIELLIAQANPMPADEKKYGAVVQPRGVVVNPTTQVGPGSHGA